MKDKGRLERLLAWSQEPTELELEQLELPADFDEQAMNWWKGGNKLMLGARAQEEDLAQGQPEDSKPSESPKQQAIVICIEKWKQEHPLHPTVIRSRLRKGSLEAPGHRLAIARGQSSDEQADAQRPYQEGDVLVLDLPSPDDNPHYITVLLQRGDTFILAYPYSRDDEYKPMNRLELAWEVEKGEKDRSFLVFFSQEPLVTMDQLVEEGGAWTQASIQRAIDSIRQEKVTIFEEHPWRCE